MNHSSVRILLLEDDPNLGQVVQEHLHMNGFEVTLCTNGESGWLAVKDGHFDLCLVDIMMPKLDGFGFAERLRQRDLKMPFIFLTARSLKEDKIRGFKTGCDDYITKPFSIEELLLRIEAVLKRTRHTDLPGQRSVIAVGQYRFDATRSTLDREGDIRRLTPKESELLHLLCQHMNTTLSREEALRQVWDSDSYFSGRSMDVFVSRLRKYLKDDTSVEILGIHGQGFRLVVTPSEGE